ncbi:MAG TPA: hypothetical protein VF255_10750 [Solirubrobacterales bacterium]
MDGTWNTIVMLLVAFGVGLVGGIGAAFIEWRQRCANPSAVGQTCNSEWSAISCIVLGGLAAVAILYFFPPTQEVLVPVEGKEPEKTISYNLVELVALALIVGTGGAAFLQALQTRTLALTKAQQAETATATALAAVGGITRQAEESTEAQIKAASTQLKSELQKSTPLPLDQAEEIVDELADQASTAVAENIQFRVEAAQRVIAAAAGGEQPDLATAVGAGPPAKPS